MSRQAARWRADTQKLRVQAAQKGLFSVRAIAEYVGVSPTWAQMVIADRRQLTSTAAGRFASALGVEVDEVFEPATVHQGGES